MRLRSLQFAVFAGLLLLWHVFTTPGIVPPVFFERDNQAAFFFGEPIKIFWAIFDWFWTGEIFVHLGVTLLETMLGFVIGSTAGLVIGLWLALSDTASAVMEPYIKGFNSMPRVVLAPIFAVWFGLGIWSKVALGVTLVFFVRANARMLGASQRQLLRSIYLPSAMSWVFASLHNAVGLAFVGAVVGEYLGSAKGVGYLILQAEGTFDINTVFAGIVVLTIFALILDAIVGAIERRLMTWQPKAGVTEKV